MFATCTTDRLPTLDTCTELALLAMEQWVLESSIQEKNQDRTGGPSPTSPDLVNKLAAALQCLLLAGLVSGAQLTAEMYRCNLSKWGRVVLSTCEQGIERGGGEHRWEGVLELVVAVVEADGNLAVHGAWALEYMNPQEQG